MRVCVCTNFSWVTSCLRCFEAWFCTWWWWVRLLVQPSGVSWPFDILMSYWIESLFCYLLGKKNTTYWGHHRSNFLSFFNYIIIGSHLWYLLVWITYYTSINSPVLIYCQPRDIFFAEITGNCTECRERWIRAYPKVMLTELSWNWFADCISCADSRHATLNSSSSSSSLAVSISPLLLLLLYFHLTRI